MWQTPSMTCAACAKVVPDGLRFCTSCGEPLAQACPGCGADAPAGTRFCGHCGHALESGAAQVPTAPTASAPPVGTATSAREPGPHTAGSRRERKVATILFADIVGFTALNEDADPEVVQALVSRAFERLSAEVERHEGLVEKFAGDAMLAVFGVPTAHEDDAERAVRAALQMQRSMRRLGDDFAGEGHDPLRVRIGIETGEVLVDLDRVAGDRDRMVMGDPVNTAARLQQAADPGEVVVGPDTHAATRDLARFEELPPLELKGKRASVPAWRVVDVVAARSQRRASSVVAPLVGRRAELSLLRETMERTSVDGRPHLVTIMGAAGAGKSRLLHETELVVDGLPLPWHWRVGSCLAYGQPTYGPLADAVKADAGVLDDDEPAVARKKLERRAEHLGCTDEEIRSLAALLADAAERRAEAEQVELFGHWQRYLERLADRHPLVLVLEDLHWADAGTLDFVESLAQWGSGAILVVATARHELRDQRKRWAGGLANASTIVLERFDDASSRRLVRELAGPGTADELVERIATVGEGNPLFLEELVRSLRERGVIGTTGDAADHVDIEAIEVPPTIQAVLAARLDALPAPDKAAAQAASVVGRRFWASAVAALTGASTDDVRATLRRLQSRELVVPVEESSLSGELEWSFRHALIRDAAYDGLPLSDRARRHVEVTHWARAHFAGREEEIIELLATHLLDGLDYARRSPTGADLELVALGAEALDLTRRAARRTASLGQLETAATWFGRAIDLADASGTAPRIRFDLLSELAEVSWMSQAAGDLLDVTERALALADDVEATPDERAQLIDARAVALVTVERPEEATALVRAALDRLEPEELSARARLHTRLGWIGWRTADLDTAEEVLPEAIREAREVGDERTERWALQEYAIVAEWSGDLAAARERFHRSWAMARAADDHRLLTRCYVNSATLDEGTEQAEAGIEMQQEGLRRARLGGVHYSIGYLANNLGELHLQLQRIDEAEAYVLEGMRSNEQVGERAQLATSYGCLVLIEMARGDLAAARVHLEALEGLPTENLQSSIMIGEVRALMQWQDEPVLAAVSLHRNFDDNPDAPLRSRLEALVTCTRAQVRANGTAADLPLLELPEQAVLGDRALARWAQVLTGPASIAGITELAAVSGDLKKVAWRRFAAGALADAALFAARLDLPEAAELVERSRSTYDGTQPELGPLPETRWH